MDKVRSTLGHVRDRFQPPPGGFERLAAGRARRERNRRGAAVVMAMTLTAGLSFGLWSVMRDDLSSRPRPGGTVSVRVGGSPVDIAIGEGGVWVATQTDRSGSGEVVRIDPVQRRVVARVAMRDVGALAVGEGAVWVANLKRQTVTAIDVETTRIVDIVRLPPLPYEVATGDRAFVPENIATGFGRMWVSTARGAVASVETRPRGAVVNLVTSVQGAILGGVATGAGSVWTWNIFEPPEAEVWRIDPQTGEQVASAYAPGPIETASAGSAGLWMLHAGSGRVSLVEARTNEVRTIGGIAERAIDITVVDPNVYVVTASGAVYSISQGSEEAAFLTRVASEPLALSGEGEALWVASSDGTVTEVTLKNQVPPEPEVAPTPTATAETPAGRIAGAFYPETYREGDDVIMPVTVVDGTKAELVFDERLRPSDLGVQGFTVGGLGRIDRDINLRYGPEPIYEMYSGPIETYEGVGGTPVQVWNPPPDEEDCPYLVFRFGKWFATTRTCSPDLSEADKREWARSLKGRETDDGFLVLDARRSLVVQKTGGAHGPELVIETHGEGPWIIVRPGSCKTDEPAEDQIVRVAPDGLKVNFGSYDGTWYADWCEDGGMYVSVEAPDKGYVEMAMNGGLRVRNLSLAG